jgi:Glycosyl transferase family 2
MFFLRKNKPLLSVIVVAWSMPRQIANTVYSLSGANQRDVDPADYEIILVENRSANLADQVQLQRLAGNLRYFMRNERLPTPVNAINYGAGKARGQYLAIMIDGARLVTPRMVDHTLQCFRATEAAVVGAPGYHLGKAVQQESSLQGYDEAYEQELLASVDWRREGYRLFDISCPSKSCERGLFAPLPESNWLDCRASCSSGWAATTGASTAMAAAMPTTTCGDGPAKPPARGRSYWPARVASTSTMAAPPPMPGARTCAACWTCCMHSTSPYAGRTSRPRHSRPCCWAACPTRPSPH